MQGSRTSGDERVQCRGSVSPAAFLALLLAQMYTTVREPPLPPRPTLSATRTRQPPVIDGKLDDAAWRATPLSDKFTQHFPDEGAPPSERTELRVVYDDRN